MPLPRCLALLMMALLTPLAHGDKPKPDLEGFKKVVQPFLKKNCFRCHGPKEMKGDLTLHDLEGDLTGDGGAVLVWKLVLGRLDADEMPPEDEPRPDEAEKKKVMAWIRAEARKAGDCGAEPAEEVPTFTKRTLTDRYYCDGVTAGDINRDGHVDIIAGPFWYAGPRFKEGHAFYEPVPLPPAKSPSNSMFSYVHDFNADGWPDILVLGRVHLHKAYWYENPRGAKGPWKKHFVFTRIRGESPPFVDVDGDGSPELVGHWLGRWGLIRPDKKDPYKEWTFRPITEAGDYNQFYHGTGVGDVNGDGRADLILNDGWWEQPASGAAGKTWKAHPFTFGKRGGAQMFAYDIDGDGDNDIVTSLDAHGWGLAWFEQVRDAGKITFRKHVMMGDRSEAKKYGVAFSQPHALALADLDGDGLKDVVVGKRRWAHGPKGDIEPDGEPVVYGFLLRRTPGVKFEPLKIDGNSGVGVQITAADVTGDGRADVLTASKLGTFVFVNGPGAGER